MRVESGGFRVDRVAGRGRNAARRRVGADEERAGGEGSGCLNCDCGLGAVGGGDLGHWEEGAAAERDQDVGGEEGACEARNVGQR